jgi:hypothetical protein
LTSFAYVFLRLIAMALPPAALGWWLRIYPRRPLVWMAAVPALAAIAVVFLPDATYGILALDGVLGFAALADLCTLPRRRSFSLQRATGRIASLQKPHAVTVTLVNHASRRRNRSRPGGGCWVN